MVDERAVAEFARELSESLGTAAAADSATNGAEDAGAAYDKALAEARSRAQILAQETRSKLAAESDAKRKVLEADLGQRLAEAESTIAAKKAQAMGNVRTIATDTAAAIVERLTGKAPSTQTIEAALDNVKP